ncbi:glycosyltransferase [Chloroflexota bacterium]
MTRSEEAIKWFRENYHLSALEILGEGKEAIVVTDGARVYKYFTSWQPQPGQTPGPEILVSRLLKQGTFKTLYPVDVRWRDKDLPLFIYPYEESVPYSGGLEEDFIKFLHEATRSGFTMSNVHPDNFIVTSTGLRLVDYGTSFHPWTEEGFIHMARRVWLTIQCHNRGDLKILMREALTNQELTELSGFDDFLNRAYGAKLDWSPSILGQPPSGFVKLGQEVTLDSRVVSIVMAVAPRTVFDYGCGKGKISEAIAKQGVKVTGWDLDPAKIARCISYGSEVSYLDSYSDVSNITERFDVVICSLVGCIIEDEKIPEVLSDIRRLVSDNGRVVFTICNPFYTLEGPSEMRNMVIPNEARYRNKFKYFSHPISTGRKTEEYHRPWDWYKRKLMEAGLRIAGIEESEGISVETGWPYSDYIIAVLEPVRKTEVSLVIRACALEADTIDIQVRHIIRQLGCAAPIHQRIVAVDSRKTGFPRKHGKPDFNALIGRLQDLKDEGLIDEISIGPEDTQKIVNLNKRWFGLNDFATHAVNGQAVAAMLSAVECCQHEYIVALDVDIMIYNPSCFDVIEEAVEVLRKNPNAVTASLNIVQETSKPWTCESDEGSWRVEARVAVFSQEKMLDSCPLPNSINNGLLEMPWHRSLDARILQNKMQSFRGGDKRAGFIHPPNQLKWPGDEWLDVLERIESGFVPREQLGKVNLFNTGDEWYYPKRSEPYVFVVCGRNVNPGRLKRCVESVRVQEGPSWGAIVIDDASDNGAAEYTEIIISTLKGKVTYIRNKLRKGGLANLHHVVHNFVENPETVIITLDSDDALIGNTVLQRVAGEYEKRADVTVGSMKRTDKDSIYPVNFDSPREKWGGNVWQHLRTFKKHLFDNILEEDLKIDGTWIEMASDWAYMLPIVEMSSNPVYIPDQLYLHEPSKDKHVETLREERENNIAKIVAKPPYPVGRSRH